MRGEYCKPNNFVNQKIYTLEVRQKRKACNNKLKTIPPKSIYYSIGTIFQFVLNVIVRLL